MMQLLIALFIAMLTTIPAQQAPDCSQISHVGTGNGFSQTPFGFAPIGTHTTAVAGTYRDSNTGASAVASEGIVTGYYTDPYGATGYLVCVEGLPFTHTVEVFTWGI